ncbi:type I restriction-modification system subunit M [Methanococcoides orientis]|uniref:class I SAM-dependent DNA methyltransferase n=1 Tax=Methanococcoides orientis TaxID=2822137 RepID=UPI001E437C24|nr:class I SAM-dependent DNA methyltransferase [Methanococcoides orientis]UGV39823.1 type I restriction-modification system subunit M [Methanococcoides orientis]
MEENEKFLEDLDNKLWTSADKLRSNLDAAVYKHVVLGLVFLKYVSDAFEERRKELLEQFKDPEHDYYLGGDEELETEELEIRDYYTEKNVFWVPALARWDTLQSCAKLSSGAEINIKNEKIDTYKMVSVGRLLDDAMEAIEKDNPKLKGVLTKDYARLQIESGKLGELIDLIATIPFRHKTLKAKDILGHVYEYFLGEFASGEGKKGGQYYTPKSIVTLIVEMLEPFQGRVYDPACGSGGFFVQSERFVEEHGGRIGQLSIYGQESNPTTWRLACMNMVIRGMDFDFGKEFADTFTRDLHPDLRANYIMTNPPFNMKEWGGEYLKDDPRWKYGLPPTNNANFAWMQHMIYHLAPNGSLALLLSNGSMSSNTNNEGVIRKSIIESDLVECMIALPGQLFTNTQIPACIWFLTRNKEAYNENRARKGETLFINARDLGYMKNRVLRDFDYDKDILRIANTFHAWKKGDGYEDEPGFCKSVDIDYIRKHEYVLTPGRYVGVADLKDDVEPFEEKMEKLTKDLSKQFKESAQLETNIRVNLLNVGYEIE